ncbi:hypothetical protein DFH09DRAFT_1312663 [Mycena vulgaris]|nr:hypothetical protein DFH09DRAFT_1312663 [Mycena vulgaris]
MAVVEPCLLPCVDTRGACMYSYCDQLLPSPASRASLAHPPTRSFLCPPLPTTCLCAHVLPTPRLCIGPAPACDALHLCATLRGPNSAPGVSEDPRSAARRRPEPQRTLFCVRRRTARAPTSCSPHLDLYLTSTASKIVHRRRTSFAAIPAAPAPSLALHVCCVLSAASHPPSIFEAIPYIYTRKSCCNTTVRRCGALALTIEYKKVQAELHEPALVGAAFVANGKILYISADDIVSGVSGVYSISSPLHQHRPAFMLLASLQPFILPLITPLGSRANTKCARTGMPFPLRFSQTPRCSRLAVRGPMSMFNLIPAQSLNPGRSSLVLRRCGPLSGFLRAPRLTLWYLVSSGLARYLGSSLHRA